MEQVGKYRVDRDPDGNVLILTEDGAKVMTDADNREFCEFLTVASEHARSLKESFREFAQLQPGRYFAQEDDFIEFCKKHGTTPIVVDEDGSGPQLALNYHVTLGPRCKFFEIVKSVASEPINAALTEHGTTRAPAGLYLPEQLYPALSKPEPTVI